MMLLNLTYGVIYLNQGLESVFLVRKVECYTHLTQMDSELR